MLTKTAAPPPPEAAKPAKRTTRSSIRHSLNLASVGKALADVMNKEKDGKDTDRKKDSTRRQSASSLSLSSKETAARRTSTINISKGGSTLESVPEGQAKGTINSSNSSNTPDQKTVTATRRISSSLQRAGRSSVDETGVKVTSTTTPSQSTTVNNRTTTTLRPRKPAAPAANTAGSSALPKYRPKSVIVEGSPKETLSAIRVGTRRKHSTSEEDKEDKDSNSLESSSLNGVSTEMDKAARPISPIPRRASKSSGSRSASIDCGRRSLSRDARSSLDRTPTTSTPPRPKKTQRPSSSPVLKKSGLPRPSPRGDTSSASGSPHTPSSAKKLVSRYLPGSSSSGRDSPSPLRTSATANTHARRSTITSIKKGSITSSLDSNQNTPTAPIQLSSSTSTKEVGNDSIDDIEMMLPAVTSPSAPTPAIPRIGSVYQAPEPPDLARHPTSILDLSLSLSTPQSERLSLPPSRRTTPNRRPAADRNSTVAWQALADLSLEINADQLQGGLITELDLPSTPLGLISPSPSMMRLDSEDGHERCPTPLNLGSPSKYASISQLLLSNGSTGYPTAAPHLLPPNNNNKNRNNLNRKKSNDSDAIATESAAITLLKLQLASMENLAKERLTQISKLEEQMHVLKESRKRDERELLTHVNELEERLHETLAAQQQLSRSRAASVCSMRSTTTSSSARGGDAEDSLASHEACQSLLESRIRELEDTHANSLTEALSSLAQRERAERTRLLIHLDSKQRLTLTARDAQQTWRSVHEIAECDLEAIRANRDTLDVLRAGLDLFERQMRSGCDGGGKVPVGVVGRFHLS